MKPFRIAHASADRWTAAAQECVEALGPLPAGAGPGFVYLTEAFAADCAQILEFLRRQTGVMHWVGGVGMGVCAGTAEYFGRPGLAVMVAALPPDSYRVFPAISESADELAPELRAWIGRVSPPFGIIHADPFNTQTPELIAELTEATAGFLVGGLTSSRDRRCQVAGDVTGGGVSGILFAPGVEVATGLTQGCAPIGPTHIVSDCLDNVVIGLDGRRALDVFKEDVGELLARDLTRVGGFIHAALPVEGSDTGDFMVRNLTGIDPERGWLALGAGVGAGDRLLFVRRDPATAERELETMLERLKARLPGPPRGGVYATCVARGVNMFGAEGREMEVIRSVLGDIPMIGFAAAGEISNGRLYGYTGVLTLFL